MSFFLGWLIKLLPTSVQTKRKDFKWPKKLNESDFKGGERDISTSQPNKKEQINGTSWDNLREVKKIEKEREKNVVGKYDKKREANRSLKILESTQSKYDKEKNKQKNLFYCQVEIVWRYNK